MSSSWSSPRLTRLIVICAMVLVTGALFIPFPFRSLPLPVRQFFDNCHFVLFLLVSMGLTIGLRRFPNGIILALAASVALAVAVEIVQPLVGRSAELHDLLYDILGIVFGLTLASQLKNGTWSLLKVSLYSLVLAFVIVVVPALPATFGYLQFVKNYPVLSDFSRQWYGYLWMRPYSNIQRPWYCVRDDVHQDGRFVWNCRFNAAPFSSMEFSPGTMDWSDFSRLQITIENPGSAFQMHVRLDASETCSSYACRFNRSITIEPGVQTYSIALEPQPNFNFNTIIRMVLFTSDEPEPGKLYLQKIELQ